VLLRALDPFLRNLNPLLTGLGLYKNEVSSLFGNVAAATNAVHLSAAGDQVHFLRLLGPLGPETLATYDSRTTTNRNSAYSQPRYAERLAKGLLNFHTYQCGAGLTATLDPDTPTDEAFTERTDGDEAEAADFFGRLKHYAFADQESSATIPAPGCEPQAPFEPIYGSGPATVYQQTFEQGE
jgi:hypothetical protein